MWCESGFECVQDITANHPDNWAKAELFNIMQGSKHPANPLGQQISMMTMRARMNGQRNYEIYWFTASDSMSKEDIDEWVDADCQSAVDWIRINGTNIFGCARPKVKPMIA